ncbi:MAG: serine/threonine-protein kinase [Gordonia sp. (in: high G+C Gram-positive bacteria)]|uniref:serine/threonine-protein kinase n=1 Tax=Gordonia sp. (in: high G+C Gram-positive bacteria) TaxID=84139 RepID=UPI0039E5BD6E
MSSDSQGGLVGSDFGWYRINALIGRGGMGDVYRAYDRKRDREVALKVLAMRGGDDGTFAERFRRECQVVARLGEPHVIPIHDYGDIDGTLFLDMRLVEGATLRDLLKQQGALDPYLAIDIAGQVASALGAAHRAGIVHRDIKPENILVTEENFAYLVDFGIAVAGDAAAADRLTRTGTAVGSTAYMAPEQFEGTGISPATDIYSLTTVLYELLVGRPAHRGTSISEILKSVLIGSVPPASSVRPGLPPALDAVLARGMEQQAGDRYGTAAEMVTAAREAMRFGTGNDGAMPPVLGPTTAMPSARQTDLVPLEKNPPHGSSGPQTATSYAATAIGSGGHATIDQRPSSPSIPSGPVSVPAYSGPVGVPASSGPMVVPVQVYPAPPQRSTVPLLILTVFIVVGAIAAIVIMLVANDDDVKNSAADSSSQAEPQSADTQTTTLTQSQTQAAVTQAPTNFRTPPGNYGAGLTIFKTCDAGSAVAVFTGYSTTSCGFATNIASQLAGVNPNSGPRNISAFSAEYGDSLPMSCGRISDSNPIDLWRCQGGWSGNAVVFVYP